MAKKKKKHGKSYHKSRSNVQNGEVRAKKHLGQHFLKDENIARQIGDTLSLNTYSKVLEIGPGMGVLTKYLLQKEVDVFAMDLDSESIEYLQTTFLLEHQPANAKNSFEVIEADFLKYDITQLFGDEPFAITGNFPYNISSQIVFKALEHRSQIPEFSGMFQKEVAERICEKEGSKTYGILSVLTQAFYDAEYLFTVPPEVFNPPPKVQSGVLRLTRKKDFSLPCDERMFFRVVKAAFQQRRKTLRNSLKTFNLTDNLKEDAIFDRRPEQMSVQDFITLTVSIEKDVT
ncbi:16S rRNA (adenine(1518)-N(6)/adenine(1519)-N(6))-dimethyltransferase RsmA [Galbibacter sp. EGI 63066]|uniref:16S rRNA (adenine(1518)-N(6)/adenine(1519)-N(6))- dimethyltransferase RsmA n=1 Tax=Galbibacter sp. EGI 63066 TaxID=2993559 RepID=UPI002248FCF4|nr:16S rRNA (adenine(1518)-N(6)/adenine(1519)-N(6))-dimethyltransferase RsmA [Galbibacter sp. EGI 63066]MCX2681108.1 16S rRNA (adenine(1518)-N(6)/adenine(1519)-N(6))-dimethyltransferase RsmA [Galbibacter sp. EGI 63066]